MSALPGPRPRQLELVCFAALAALASLQWASLVANPPAARVTLAVALATGAGAALAAIARLRLTRPTLTAETRKRARLKMMTGNRAMESA